MLPYTLDSHFTYGYGEGVFNHFERKPEDSLWCAYSRCRRQPGTFQEECVSVARALHDAAQQRGRIPVVMLSGGMDSEVAAKSFIDGGLPFEAWTFRYPNRLNAHELRFVDSFVKRHGLKHRYVDLDVLPWIQTEEAAQVFEDSKAVSCGLISHMKLMQQIWDENGMPILGNGDVYLENMDGVWKYVELDYMLSWFRFAVARGILGGIGFFQHTPEITLAMLREPKIERLGLQQDPYATRMYQTSRFVKYNVYRKHWPDLLLRPKFMGNELVRTEFKARAIELLQHREVEFTDKFVLSYTDFREMLEP